MSATAQRLREYANWSGPVSSEANACMAAAADELDALHEEIDLLRARSPRKYILTRKSEWVRLFREVHGYLRTCHRQHGTDWSGRNHAMDALIEGMKFMEADDAARDTILAAMREAERAPNPQEPKTEATGTELYQRQIVRATGEHADMMRERWSRNSWMLDVFTGPCGEDRDMTIRRWLRDTMGDEAWPFDDDPRAGRWLRGNVTLHGWTWIGFATEADMSAFLERWPSPEITNA